MPSSTDKTSASLSPPTIWWKLNLHFFFLFIANFQKQISSHWDGSQAKDAKRMKRRGTASALWSCDDHRTATAWHKKCVFVTLVWTQQYRWLNLWTVMSQFLFPPLFDCVFSFFSGAAKLPLNDFDSLIVGQTHVRLLECRSRCFLAFYAEQRGGKKERSTTVLFPADCLHGAFVSSATCRDSAGSLELIVWCAPSFLSYPPSVPRCTPAHRHPYKCTQNDKKKEKIHKVSRALCQQTAATALVYAGDEWDRSLLDLPK